MNTYKEFLDKCNIISEEQWNNMISLLPDDINVSQYLVEFMFQDEINDLCICLINDDLQRYDVWVDDLYLDTKEFYLHEVPSIEVLEEIKNRYSNWTIINYNDLIEEINNEIEVNNDRIHLMHKISTFSTELLKQIINDYSK